MEMGGLENLVFKMSKLIKKEKFNVSVLCLSGYDPVYRDELQKASVPLYLINKNGPFDILFFKKIIALRKEKRIAVSDEILDLMKKQFPSQADKSELLVNGIYTEQFMVVSEFDMHSMINSYENLCEEILEAGI